MSTSANFLPAILGFMCATGLSAAAQDPQPTRLIPVRTLVHATDPLAVDVVSPGSVELLLLDESGAVLSRVGAGAAGRIDIAQLMTPVRELKSSAYLQAVVDGQPTGAALVVQPLRGRPTVRTTMSLRPDSTTKYTRVIGWGSELLDGASEADLVLQQVWIEGDEIVTSGFRLEPERDALLVTDRGSLRVAMCPTQAPATVRNFMTLAESGFYDSTIFHRVVPAGRDGHPFVVQGGDPTGTGNGGPGYDIALEPSRLPHAFGVISMARADEPDSAGSQFFLCLSREGTARLDGQYCAFGYAIEGAAELRALADVQIQDAANGRPVIPPRLIRVELVPATPHQVDVDRRSRRIRGEDAPAQDR